MPVNSKNPPRRDRLLSRAWAIDYMGNVSVRDFDKFFKKEFPVVRLGGKTFYRERDILAWEDAINRKVLALAGLEF